MNKVIKMDKKMYAGEKYNKLKQINDALAKAENMSILCIPLRKQLRKHIIRIHKKRFPDSFRLSQKDIKRLERPDRCEVSVNTVDVLEILLDEISGNFSQFDYKVEDDRIVSCHILYNTINALIDFKEWLDAHKDDDEHPENGKYRDSVNYLIERIRDFNANHPETFEEFLKQIVGEDGG